MIRQLSAIMFADMVGYTALMQTDERKAKAQRDRQRQVLEARVAEYEGKILQYYGDGALSIFQSAIQAVKCAISIQGDLTREPTVPLRIGIHVGDVVHDQEGVYGDGVNLASRIQDLSVAGGILISGKVADEVKNHPDIATEPLGEYRLKNVERPQAVFAITNSGIAVPTPREVRQWPEANAKRWARRRNLRIAGALVGISAIAGVSYWALSLRSRPGEDPLVGLPAAFERVAVLPFDVPGEEASPLGAKFQILLSSSLTRDVLRPVDRELVNSFLTGTPFSEETQLETGKTVAERTRANLFTTGTVLAVGDSLTVTANVWDLEPNRVASAESSGTSEMLFAVSDSLARQILIQLGRTDPAFLGDFPTESVEALNHFVDGDNAYKAADYPKAMEDLRKAIEIDDDFALAWFRLSQAATWAWHWNTNKESARKAAATDRLSSMNIETVIAWNDFLAGRPEVAEEKYWRLANRYPGLTEAWNGLGEVMVHYNLLRGEPTDAARSHFERVLEIEPSYGEARFHMLEFAARERDRRAFDSLLAGVNPESNQHLPWRAVRAYGFGSPADKAQIRA
jgi:class 3 adenylate cyclase